MNRGWGVQPHSICPLLRCRLALAAPQAKVMRPPGLRRAPQVGDHLCRGPGAAGPSPPHLCEDRAPDIGRGGGTAAPAAFHSSWGAGRRAVCASAILQVRNGWHSPPSEALLGNRQAQAADSGEQVVLRLEASALSTGWAHGSWASFLSSHGTRRTGSATHEAEGAGDPHGQHRRRNRCQNPHEIPAWHSAHLLRRSIPFLSRTLSSHSCPFSPPHPQGESQRSPSCSDEG